MVRSPYLLAGEQQLHLPQLNYGGRNERNRTFACYHQLRLNFRIAR